MRSMFAIVIACFFMFCTAFINAQETERPAGTPAQTVKPEIGYLNVTTLGLASGNEQEVLSLYTTHGIHYGKYFGFGIGIGADFYEDVTAVPIFFDGRAYLLPSRTTPYLMIQVGYTNGWAERSSASHDLGFMARLGGGICIQEKSPGGFVIEGGYKIQKLNNWYYRVESLHMVSVSAGFTFR